MIACACLKAFVLGSMSQSEVLTCPQAFLPTLDRSRGRDARPASSIPMNCCCLPGFSAWRSLSNLYSGEVRKEQGPWKVAQPPGGSEGGGCKCRTQLRTSSQQPSGVGTPHQSISWAVLLKRQMYAALFSFLIFWCVWKL